MLAIQAVQEELYALWQRHHALATTLAERVLGWTHQEETDWWVDGSGQAMHPRGDGGGIMAWDPINNPAHLEELLDFMVEAGWNSTCYQNGMTFSVLFWCREMPCSMHPWACPEKRTMSGHGAVAHTELTKTYRRAQAYVIAALRAYEIKVSDNGEVHDD